MSALTFEAVHGELSVPTAAAGLADASAALPDGAYTTLRTYQGDRVFRLGDHVERLRRSAGPPGDPSDAALNEVDVQRAIAAALRKTRHTESRLRLTFAPPRLFVTVEPFDPLPAELYQHGVWCVTVPVVRANPQAKDTRFLPAAQQAYARLPPGAHEGLLLSEDGRLLEGLSSNFFAIQEGQLYTEEEQALHGITRSLVLEVAGPGLPLAGRAPRADELGRTSEAFLTSASRGVLAVVRVDDVVIGEGHPGAATLELARRFAQRLLQEAVPVA
jgi:branched-chain amino acid aminotransferase